MLFYFFSQNLTTSSAFSHQLWDHLLKTALSSTQKILIGLVFFQIYFFCIVTAIVTEIQAMGVRFVCCFALLGMEFSEAFLPQLRVIVLKLVTCLYYRSAVITLSAPKQRSTEVYPGTLCFLQLFSHIQAMMQEGTM